MNTDSTFTVDIQRHVRSNISPETLAYSLNSQHNEWHDHVLAYLLWRRQTGKLRTRPVKQVTSGRGDKRTLSTPDPGLRYEFGLVSWQRRHFVQVLNVCDHWLCITNAFTDEANEVYLYNSIPGPWHVPFCRLKLELLYTVLCFWPVAHYYSLNDNGVQTADRRGTNTSPTNLRAYWKLSSIAITLQKGTCST